jgi:recombination protein RecT
MSNALQEIVLSTRDTFASRLADKSISFEAESGFAMQALATDYAMGIALKNKQSVIDAVTNIAAIGISLNPAKKQAYLVPRDGKICLDISYMGLIDLAVATGAIKWAQAAIVYSSDNFQLRGFDEAPLHTFSPFDKNRGEIIGVYCVVKTADGEYLTHSMPISEVYAIRDRSAAWKSSKSGPWKTDEAEMIKKTCIKQAYKYWPKVNDRLQNAIQYLNTETGEGLPQLTNQPTRNPNGKQEQVRDIEKLESLVAKLEEAAKGGTVAFQTTWKALAESDKALVGIPERDRINKLAATFNQPTVIEGEFTKEGAAQ